MAAQDHGRGCRSGLSRPAQGLRGPPLRCHWGVDPFAVVRAAGQWIARGHIVSGASTLSMQAARLLEPQAAQPAQQDHRGRPCAAARMALFQARGAGDLPDAGADGRQSRGRALGLLRLFRQGAAPAQRRRGGATGRHPAIAESPPARSRARRRPSRPRRRPAARAGAWRDRPGAVRVGDRPAGAGAAPRHADECAASFGLARRPVAGRDRADDSALRIAERAQPARRRRAQPVARQGADRPRRHRQPHRRRRGLAGRRRLLRPRRPSRSGALAPLAGLGAEADDLCAGLRRPHAASRTRWSKTCRCASRTGCRATSTATTRAPSRCAARCSSR